MSITLNDNLKINVGNPIDSKYLNSSNQPYTGITAVNTSIPQSLRYVGLTVNINNVEFWYGSDITDGALVVKGVAYNISAVTTNVTLTPKQYIVLVNSPSASRTITLPSTPANGQAYRIKDVSGCALVNNIKICGNVCIDGSSCALINTNYGELEFTYSTSISSWVNLGVVN